MTAYEKCDKYVCPLQFPIDNEKLSICISLINMSQDITEKTIVSENETEYGINVALINTFVAIAYELLDDDVLLVFNDVLYKMNCGDHLFYGRFYLPLKLMELLTSKRYGDLDIYRNDVMDLYYGRRVDEIKILFENIEPGLSRIFD